MSIMTRGPSLLIPTAQAEAYKRQKQAAAVSGATGHVKPELLQQLSVNQDGEHVWSIDTEVPEGLPDPGLWRCLVFPVAQSKQIGSIILAPETMETKDWTHPLWKIAKVGPMVYRGPAYHGFPEDKLEEARPKPGELWLLDPKQPKRFYFGEMCMILINDDQLWCRVEPDQVSKITYKGMAL